MGKMDNREAVELNKAENKHEKKSPPEKKELEVPGYFTDALNNHAQALQIFESFSTAKKREYIEWITEAKSAETKNKRIATSIEWLAEGKSRNWKYSK
ncbi:MAG: hypothetical protein JWM44_3537 [Bacilli bacterium]|nr:hypothetical protein [Bacilli bacterium]